MYLRAASLIFQGTCESFLGGDRLPLQSAAFLQLPKLTSGTGGEETTGEWTQWREKRNRGQADTGTAHQEVVTIRGYD